MNTSEIKSVVIAGGGTAGWIAATALSKKLGSLLEITLIESDQIGTVGVGEATIPTCRTFHKLLGINEADLMKATNATFKLGISFENWGQKGESYIHSFGKTGQESWIAEFQHFWLEAKKRGFEGDFGDYSLELQAAKAGKFGIGQGVDLNYAYHLDATLYALFLRKIAEEHGVRRVEGKIKKVNQNSESGFIESLVLEDGQAISGDLFIDCTGFSALLIEQALHTGFDDWSHYLPCDSAVAVQTQSNGPMMPFTRSIALESGWRWRIPLQNRVGNGLVFSSRHMSDDEAISTLLKEIDAEPINQPRVIKYRPGIRRKVWNKNCVAIGLSGGFIEPLESTGIHLFMIGIARLMQYFPFGGVTDVLVEQYNSVSKAELISIRDFIVLHYHATRRDDTRFWRLCKSMEIPDTLQHRLDLFKKSAHVFQAPGELFRVDSWTQVMFGQGIIPEDYHHSPKLMSDTDMNRFLDGMKNSIQSTVAKLPKHSEFIKEYCMS